jgi:5-deoxy-glucuronate isomerase
MRYACPAENSYDPGVFRFKEADEDPKRHIVAGTGETGSLRHVWKVIDANFTCDRLMMGLCEGSSGGWAAWPPHEHAQEKEEVYVYYDMDVHFGVQLVYEEVEDPIGVFLVEDGDLVSIARGYHPNVGCPGGRINFIYCMAAKNINERTFDEMHFQQRFLR